MGKNVKTMCNTSKNKFLNDRKKNSRLAIQPVAQQHDCLEPPPVGMNWSETCNEIEERNHQHVSVL